MNKISYRVALGGVISSLCLLAMLITGIAPILYLTLPMIAGALMMIIVVEVNTSWAFLTYAAVGILSIFISFDKEASLIFILFFGHYPIIKQYLDKIKIPILRLGARLAIFNVCAEADYQLTIHLLGMQETAKEFAKIGPYGIAAVWIVLNIIFLIYDYALTGCISMYIKILKPKIFGKRK